ncbi:hypothetical protein BDW69DRAFT_197146 [Aspergillus filifer]
MSQPTPTPTLHPPSFSPVSYTIQTKSPLFTTLPPELRSLVFTFALSPYEDHSKSYAKETYWTRPGYNAPRRTCTALLRTCKAIYAEAWYMPFALAEHTFYLTGNDRAPQDGRSAAPMQFAKCLELLHKSHSAHREAEGKGEKPLEMGDICIFPQLYMLEPGTRLVTIRYTDFWFWESTEKLRIKGRWVDECVFPESVKRVVVDFEMIERRKEEVDIIVAQALERWIFKRKDDRVFTAKKEDLTVSRWTGSSMFGGRRWIRDEVRPGELDYYVLTATWKVNSEKDSAVMMQSPTWGTSNSNVAVPNDFVQPVPPFLGAANLDYIDLQRAEVNMDMSAQESLEAVTAWRQANSTRRTRCRRRDNQNFTHGETDSSSEEDEDEDEEEEDEDEEDDVY